jgi:HTH-type transcriptional repressor of NAD biosynthesis genes
LKHIPEGVDYVFASEDYGWQLAEDLEAWFVPLDPQRDRFPVSATSLREHTLEYWDFIPEPIRYYFVKQICIFWGRSAKVIRNFSWKVQYPLHP